MHQSERDRYVDQMVKAYIALLLVVGIAMTVWGTLMPLGGGSALVAVGAAGVGAGLVLIGVQLMPSSGRR
jgi:hypothetical protein